MKATLEKMSSINQCVTVEVPAEAVDRARKKVLDKMRREIKIPGFRKGKVPDNMILQRAGSEVETETVKQVVQDTYGDALHQVGAVPIGPPRVESLGQITSGAPFSYRATFEIYPEVRVEGYEGLSFEREKQHVTDEEVEVELKRLQHQMTQLEPAPDGTVGKDVVAMIDFKGTAGGESFPGSEAENYVVDFGTGNLLEEFEVQIEGMKADEERKIQFKYPDDYFRKEISGKRGEFHVKVKEVRRKIVPELNDNFAKELGSYKNLKEVKEDLKKRILEYKEHVARGRLMDQAIRKLIEKHKDLEVPTALVDAELGNMLEQLKNQLEARGQRIEDANIDPKEFVKANVNEATDRARGYMLISAISHKEGLDVTREEVEGRIALIAEQSRQPVAKIKDRLNKENKMGNVRSQILFEKTLDLILSKSKIKEVKPKKGK